MKNILTRIDPRFNNELEDIKNERLKRKIDRKKISSRKLTSLIPRYKGWGKMKEEIIEYSFKKEVNFEDEEKEEMGR